MSAEPPSALVWLLLSCLACMSIGCSAPIRHDPAGPDLQREAQALVHAAPSAWPERMRAVLARGPQASAHLVRALRAAAPDAPGRRAAIAALGALGGPVARTHLEAVLRAGEPEADEAALALARLPRAPASVQLLREVARAPDREPLVRAAAAAALLDLHAATPVADVVEAILVADTPSGREHARRLGLPEKSRWALERHVLIEAIRRRTGGTDFGLDPDAPWPRLVEGARAFTRWLRARKTDQG